MASKYYDTSAVIQTIGCIFNKPEILENEKYTFSELDFENNEFHRIIFGTIFNLYQLGSKNISLAAIEDYLEQRPKKMATYKANKGSEYLLQCKENCRPEAFDYYYNRLKKMTLLRGYESIGMDVSFIYDPDNIFDAKKKQQQEDWLDNSSLDDIIKRIDDRIEEIKGKYADGIGEEGVHAGAGIMELLQSFEESPSYGFPMYGKYMNTITRGARLGKFYLRSAATGVGKSRSMAADACYAACSEMYDLDTHKWVSIGKGIPTLIIGTEQDLAEFQTLFLCFIAGVDEEHIMTNTYYDGEKERVMKAAQILKNSALYYENYPDYSIADIEKSIKRNIREHNIQQVYFDYIHTSMKILAEITTRSKVSVREDNILFLFAVKLKTLAVENDVFMMSSTQLNADYRESETPDQNLLRGSKAIADSIDYGSIMLELTAKDKEAITPICRQLGIDPSKVNVKTSVYKNRGNKYRAIYIWTIADKSICRFCPAFVTNWNYELIEMVDIKLKLEQESAF